ncbi:tape measure protein [uncultured Phocaeicola sp.]|uniref:tape measure protein n=1 Tax=uncultured Phocaeicola sp. TaxID=990718 RepID=UPI0026210F7E|nr:tape measure protein [uncultured Phocaeicola sp.]
MSKSVEKRIVEMRFDNQQFEKGVQTTMGTLDKLKHSLKLDGATKGLEDVDKAVKGINISGLSSAVETVKSRFSALEVVAITALANITNSVVNAGKKLVDSFTLEPIHQGFAEYELKMGSVQTIMASTGADIKTVNGYLEELNTYSDKTIYSFSDMTSSIGKFTNAGVSLDDAVKAIKGISNEAAVSGANANEASRAMYNFAQALSSGAVKLIDWKSIENANMATVEFKQSLLDTALAMGTVVKVGDKYQSTTTDAQGKISDLFTATSMFNDSLSSQWMTTDVLVQTLGNYATDVREMTAAEKKAYEEKLRGIGYTEDQIKAIEELGQKAYDSAQDVKTFSQLMDTLKEAAGSGWAQTFEILFGDLEEAKVLWTAVSQVVGGFIDQSSKARNDMLQGWKDLGGRQALIESVQNAFSGLMSVVKPVGEAFREIFPATTSEQLMNLTKGLKEFTSHLKLSDKDSQNLKNTFKGLFAVLDLVKQGIGALVKAVFPMTKGLGSLGSGVLSVTGKIGEWLVSLDQAAKKSDVFNQAIQKFHDKVSPILKSVKGHIDGAVVAIKKFAETHFNVPDTSGLISVADKLKARIEPFKKIGEVAKEAMGKLVDAFKASAPVLANLGGIIVDALGKVIDGIMKALHGEGFDSLIDLLNGGIVTGIGVGIMKFIKNLTGLESTADDAIGGFAGIIEGFKGAINGAKETLADFQASLKADILMKIAGSIAVLAGSLLVLSLIDSDKLGGALASISILFAELAASMALFDKTLSEQKGLNKFGMAMIEMSAAILVLASALKKIASIDSDKLAGALVGITVLIGEMVAASLALSKWGGKIKTSAVSMILFAEAINILANAVGKLGALDTDKLTKGLVGVGVLMAELAAFMVASKFGNFKATQGLAIIELSAALLILEKSVSGFGSMDIETIKKGLVGVGVVLAEVAGFSVIAGKAKHILSSATALTVIGAAMLIFGKAIKDIGSLPIKQIEKGLIGIGGALAAVAVATKLMPKNMVGIGLGLLEVAAALKIIGSVIRDAGGMKWEEIGKGMVVLAGSMTILAVALNAMKGTLGGASAMLVMSAALAVFTPVLKSLGSMSLAEIGKGLLALAGAFTVLGIAGAVLGSMVPAILGLSGALALLGVAVAACGVGILAFSAGLASLAVSGVAGVTALVAALEILIVGVLGIIANSATAIAGAVKAIVLAIVDVIVECAPPIAEGVLTLIEEVLKSLAEHGPNIVTYLMDFLIGVINAIAARLPELIKAAVNLIGAFFKGVVDALKGIDTNVLLEGIVGIGLLSAIMLALSAVAGLIPGAMAGVLGMGVVIAEMSLVLAAVGAFAQLPGLKWLVGEGGDLLQGVGTAIGKFIGGIVGGFLGGISAQFPQIGQDLTDFMTNAQGFIEGAKKIDPAMLQGVNALAQTILLLTAANILDGLTKWFTGGTSLVKFGEELAEFGPYFKRYSDEIAGINPEVITASSNAALALAEMASKLPNSGGLAGKIFGENNLSDFGAELEKFGPYIKRYGDQVKGLDSAAVKASAEAAQMMADMAATLPNSGGLAAKIMGDNTLSAFGEELEKFGPHISKYAKDVNGVDPAAVKASAQAAQVLSDMASTLPNSGGLAALIMGDNTLSEFGEELEKFGPHIAKYAQDVANVQPTVVTASANAAKALSELANNLPNTGGLVSWFTGDNDIGAFGQSLEKFGQSFAGYYNSIAGIDTALLDAVIVELGKLVDMANGISGVDTSGFTRFASDLTTMGNNGIDGFIQAFTNANEKVQQGVTALLTTVTSTMQAQVGTLTASGTTAGQSLGTGLINGINTQKPLAVAAISGMCVTLIQTMQAGLPSATFNTIGQTNVMQGLINGLNAKRALLLSTARNHCTALVQQFRTSLPSATFNTIGQNVIQAIINGMNAKRELLLATARNLCVALVAKFRTELPTATFQTLGEGLVQALVNGIKSKQSTAEEAARAVCSATMNAFRNNLSADDLKGVGANAAQGLADGIRSKINEIADAAIDAAKRAVREAKKELDEHSPSKVFFKIGENVDLGMINGIRAYLRRVGDAGTELGRETIDSMKSAIRHISDIVNREMDTEPTIRPVLDMTNVQNGVSEINSLFTKGLNMSASYNKALSAARDNKISSVAADNASGNYQQPASNTYSFVQNNYSPKALSRKDIYRQTKNQFAAMKGAVSST